MSQLADNVWSFMEHAADLHAAERKARFSQEMHANCLELGMESPIEHMFWIACATLCDAAYTEINPEPTINKSGELVLGGGLFIRPQARLGTYRVDFALMQNGIGPDHILTPVVVELDGHAFHDKDKRQRSYEKARDRFLVKAGYRVLHFTGSDVVADPFKVAYESLDLLGVFSGLGIDSYDKSNPLGQELS
jgi:very-short-patch-repair endonuclease